MDRLRDMEAFVAVAEAGSFARAGLRLRLSPPAVTRAVAALETRLGARLFNRTTRRVSLTETGSRFLDTARRLLAELEQAEKEVVGEAAVPHGTLSLTASVTFGRSALMPVVGEFLAHHPRVSMSLLLLDRVVNLVDEGIDLAVRIGELPESSLVARRVGTVRRVLVASPAYLAKHGRPRTPADLREHAIIAFTGVMPNREWRHRDRGRSRSMALAPRLEVNDAGAALAAAERGDGVAVALSYMVAQPLADRRLTLVLQGFAPDAVPVHLVYPRSRMVAPKLRAFIDFAAPRLQRTLAQLDVDRAGR